MPVLRRVLIAGDLPFGPLRERSRKLRVLELLPGKVWLLQHLRGKGEFAPSEQHVFYSAVGKAGGDTVRWEGRKVLTIRTNWDLSH